MQNYKFKAWLEESHPEQFDEGVLEKIDKVGELIPQLGKYLPLAFKEVVNNPDYISVIQNRSAILALVHSLNRVTPQEIQEEIKSLELKDAAQVEIIVRQKLIPVWRVIVRLMDIMHITPLVEYSIPKSKEFITCFNNLFIATDKEDFKKNAICAGKAFLQMTHQIISTSFISALMAKVALAFGALSLAGWLGGMAYIIWALLALLVSLKGKTSGKLAEMIALIIRIFSPGDSEKKKRPPVFTQN
jgi:hypothetical protein